MFSFQDEIFGRRRSSFEEFRLMLSGSSEELDLVQISVSRKLQPLQNQYVEFYKKWQSEPLQVASSSETEDTEEEPLGIQLRFHPVTTVSQQGLINTTPQASSDSVSEHGSIHDSEFLSPFENLSGKAETDSGHDSDCNDSSFSPQLQIILAQLPKKSCHIETLNQQRLSYSSIVKSRPTLKNVKALLQNFEQQQQG
eukprot:TRINITY_DN404_c0_g1_i3.p4 TRINITY_DN404_c0_g1~~TRINITY_DN404_c0_g1_i3.p4  ORF type:complete len:197 (-),score=20.66 TRINITY_DN404_c0_g1_i3:392-982(-)